MRLRLRTLTAGIAAPLIGIAPVARPADQTATRAALQPMLEQLRAELALTDGQVERGEQILAGWSGACWSWGAGAPGS